MTESGAIPVGCSDAREALLRCQDAADPQAVYTILCQFLLHRATGLGLQEGAVRAAFEAQEPPASLSITTGRKVIRLLGLFGEGAWPEDIRAWIYWSVGTQAQEGFLPLVLEGIGDRSATEVVARLRKNAAVHLEKLAHQDQDLFHRVLKSLDPHLQRTIQARLMFCRVLLNEGPEGPEDPESYRVEINQIRAAIRRGERQAKQAVDLIALQGPCPVTERLGQ